MLSFQLLRTPWVTFLVENSIRSTPLAAHLPHTEAITHMPQIVTYRYMVVEKGMEDKGE